MSAPGFDEAAISSLLKRLIKMVERQRISPSAEFGYVCFMYGLGMLRNLRSVTKEDVHNTIDNIWGEYDAAEARSKGKAS